MKKFLIIWIGQLVSMVGSGLVSFGLGVWIFMETGRATPFGITIFLGTLPSVILSPYAGVLADNYNRKTIMILSDLASAMMSLIVLLIMIFSELEIYHVYILSFASSIAGTFQQPAYTASIPLLVKKDLLGRANGLNQTAEAFSGLLPPLLAGILFGIIGLTGFLIIDFITFFVAVGGLMLVHFSSMDTHNSGNAEAGEEGAWTQMAFGFRFILDRPGFLGLLILASIVNFLLNFAMVTLVPYVLSLSSSATLGTIQSIGGAAMLLGGLCISVFGTMKHKILGFYAAIFFSSIGLFLMGALHTPISIGVGIFILMLAIPIGSSHSMEVWQRKVAPEKQGRVVAARITVSQILMPFAMLIAGPLADSVFVPMFDSPELGYGLMFISAATLLFAVLIMGYLHPRIRNIESEIPDIEEFS